MERIFFLKVCKNEHTELTFMPFEISFLYFFI